MDKKLSLSNLAVAKNHPGRKTRRHSKMVGKPRSRGAVSTKEIGEWIRMTKLVPVDWACLFDIRDGEVHAKNTSHVVGSSDVYLY